MQPTIVVLLDVMDDVCPFVVSYVLLFTQPSNRQSVSIVTIKAQRGVHPLSTHPEVMQFGFVCRVEQQ